MADYAISNVPRRVVYAASGTGPYAFTFEILDETDIAVYKASTLLTLTTDYTVTINANGTGSVTLVATAGSDNITIVGAKNIQRTTDFTTGGDLFANTLNDELDNQTIYIQQVAETTERGLKAPVTDPTDIAMTLPAKDGRKGKVLAFDSTTGNPVAGPSLDSVVTVIEQSANINTVAGIDSDVTTVAGISADVSAVAADATDIGIVATNIASVNTAASNIADIIEVAADLTNIDAVAAEIPNLATKVSKTSDTGSAVIPAGTTAQRDGSPVDGYFRYNSDLDSFEGYVDGAWGGVGGAQAGGVIYENGTTISADYTFGAGKNGHSVGPITINSGVSVTVGSGQRWVIV